MYFFIFLFFIIILFCFTFPLKENLNCLDLAIKPNFASNNRLGQYNESLYVDPNRDFNLRGYKRFSRERIKDFYYDPFNINCTKNKYSGFQCNLVKGNYVNTIPKKYCKKICPKEYELMENFDGGKFLKKGGNKKFWCFNTNTLKCEGNDYNYLEPNKNTCGDAWISQVPLPVYPSKQSCYNDNKRCEELNEKECLQNPNCGVCRNSLGQGNCVSATASGTLDITLPCFPNRVPKGNQFQPGIPNPFKDIMQKY